MNKVLLVAFLLLSTFQLQSQCDHPDYDELMKLYNDLGGDNWVVNEGWGEDCEPCEWYGISCNENDRIEKIILIDNNTNGQLSDYSFHYLKELHLIGGFKSAGKIYGTLPDFSGMPILEELRLNLNDINGAIPDFSNIPKLEVLLLHQNYLEGEIPEFSNIPKLEGLHLGFNLFTGSVPDFQNLQELKSLNLEFNNLSGFVPDFTNLSELRTIGLGNNQLTGTIPDFTSLTLLVHLNLFNNYLSGTIPNFSNHNKLKTLILSSNNLTGTIPSLEMSTDLNIIRLSDNNLEGCYPHKEWCSINHDFTGNHKLPFQGDYEQYCNGEPQIGAPCDDGDPNTYDDVIQDDCSCGGIISSTSDQTQNELIVYPNPASNYLIIENYSESKLFVSGASGRTYEFNSIGKGKYDISQLSPGLYFIMATEQKAKNTVLKFIKL